MTYSFECCTCGETFRVFDDNLVKKDSLICPNCSNQLPDDVFQKLKAAAKLLLEVNENSTTSEKLFHAENLNHFYYKIQ